MRRRAWTRIAIVLAGAGLAAGLIVLGRATVDTDAARVAGYRSGHVAGYVAGVREGRAEGVREGRALELAPSSPPNVDAAFQHGYTAGANDVFGGFDGGWSVATPYVVVLRASRGPVTYRIDARLPVRAGVEYYLCPRSPTVCAQPRR